MTRRWEMRRHRDLWWFVFEAIGWVAGLPARVDAWLARASGEEDEL